MKRTIILISIAVLVLAGGVAAYILMNQPETVEYEKPAAYTPDVDENGVPEGRFISYSEEAVAAEGYEKTVLFFHASWCPECQAFVKSIRTDGLPAGVQILRVDYDSETELKQKYGVTLQTTFVSVDESGTQIMKWVGYGQDKTVGAILTNT